MPKAWFAWEHSSRGYAPVIYYNELPNIKTACEKGLFPRIAASYPLAESWFSDITEGGQSVITDEVTASFDELEAAFPPPVDPVEPKFSLPLQDAAE